MQHSKASSKTKNLAIAGGGEEGGEGEREKG